MTELCVILPAYNEEENIIPLMGKWSVAKQILFEKYHISTYLIFVNDGSTDNTRAVITKFSENKSKITVLNHTENRGLGAALMTGFRHVSERHHNCKYICVMDCDNTHDPKFVSSMLEKMGAFGKKSACDVVIASRYIAGTKAKDLPRFRKVMSFCARGFYSLAFGTKGVTDYTNGYRIYSVDIIKAALKVYGERLIEEETFACTTEILCKLEFLEATFLEVPFTLQYGEKKGKSKMQVLKTATASVLMTKKLLTNTRSLPR